MIFAIVCRNSRTIICVLFQIPVSVCSQEVHYPNHSLKKLVYIIFQIFSCSHEELSKQLARKLFQSHSLLLFVDGKKLYSMSLL